MSDYIPFKDRPLCSNAAARQALGDIGKTLFYDLIKSGRLEVRKMGKKTMVTTASVLRVAEEGAPYSQPTRAPVRARRAATEDTGS